MSRSNFFENTSHSSFKGSHITNVAGDHITQIIGLPAQIISNGVRGESIFDQYRDFRRGDIRLLRELSTREVDEEKTSLWSDQEKLKYTRTAHSVSLFGVAGNYSHCIAMHYSGRDAYAAWERDLLKYSNQYGSHTHFHCLWCSVMMLFLWHKFGKIAPLLPSATLRFILIWQDGIFQKVWEAFHLQMTIPWSDPSAARTICFGSQNEEEMGSQSSMSSAWYSLMPEEPKKLLPFDLFHDETRTLEYLWGIPKKDCFSQQIVTSSPLDILSHFTHFRVPEYGHNIFPITLPFISSWTASQKNSFRAVGWFKELDRSYSFISIPWRSIPGKEGIIFKHGWTKFHYDVTNWGRTFTSYVQLPQALNKRLVSAWLCQGIFFANATGGDTSNLEHYGVTTEVEISLMPDVGTVVLHPNIIPKNIFMFIAPISQRICDLIGLPKYQVKIFPSETFCFNYQFQAIQQVQRFLGYDMLTQDFAEVHGLPLIEVTPHSEDLNKPHDQSIEELDNRHIVHDKLDEVLSSDSESVPDDTGVQSQEIWFPLPRLRQELNLNVDSCLEGWRVVDSETSDSLTQFTLSIGSVLNVITLMFGFNR
ncbi:hypothetical protein K435DRAFT_794375 [Dendrothele bispora CBS 962.96]|uniref:Uncharacterized protein n=1 Tax=Dendrothele bispora (strain CBS 962.96) TaxID=1314807 RepID=A0A4S8MCR5_DENBC|nr:hypothetical protein K435DRAFT_794375 [Dendrothele bispora CBS 962.96]